MGVSSGWSRGTHHEHQYASQIARLACSRLARSQHGCRQRRGGCADIAERSNTRWRAPARNVRAGIAHACAIDWRSPAAFDLADECAVRETAAVHLAHEHAVRNAAAVHSSKEHSVDGAFEHTIGLTAAIDCAYQHPVDSTNLHSFSVSTTFDYTDLHAAGVAATLDRTGRSHQARNCPRSAGHGSRRRARSAGDGAGVRARLTTATCRH